MRICANNGGFLPEPRSEEENTFVTNLTPNYFWLGVARDSEGRYRWQSDGANLVYTKWKKPPKDPDGHTKCVTRKRFKKVWLQILCQLPVSAYGRGTSIVCQRNHGRFISCLFWGNIFNFIFRLSH